MQSAKLQQQRVENGFTRAANKSPTDYISINLNDAKRKSNTPSVEIYVPKRNVKSPTEMSSPPELTARMNLVEEKPEEDDNEDFETPSERMETRRFKVHNETASKDKSPGSIKMQYSSEEKNVETNIVKSQEKSETVQNNMMPYQMDVRASLGSSIQRSPPRVNNKFNSGRKGSVKQEDINPITLNQKAESNFSSANRERSHQKPYKYKGPVSEKGSPTVVVYANSPPYQESNEGKLIRKLGEKQKMLDKYETMLQKVNFEFKNTLTKNKELSDEISLLEMRLQRAEEMANDAQGKIDVDKYTIQRQLDELILEKDELQSDNVSLNKLLKNKNFEIEELKNTKIELETRLANNKTDNAHISKNEIELRITIDELKKRVSELEYELKRKDDDYKTDISNYDLLNQSLKKEIEQLTQQRNTLNDQNLKLKEEGWKVNLLNRQMANEIENFKRENLNLKNTVDLIHENEKELKTENKYLRDSSMALEKVNLLYQNIITQNGRLQKV